MPPEKTTESHIDNQEVAIEKDPTHTTEQIFDKTEQLTRLPQESLPAHLIRAGEYVTEILRKKEGITFDAARIKESDMDEKSLSMIKSAMHEANISQEPALEYNLGEKNKETVAQIADSLGYHDKITTSNSESFDTTQRGRKFFEIQPGQGSAKRETYWNTLYFPYNTEATREFAKTILENKKIVLLGGGRSQLKKELEENDIFPANVVNVDPFVENVEHDADTVIPIDATAKDFMTKMSDRGIEKADEIWAEYSVPAYLENPNEIKQLLENIDNLLAEGGTARIWPLQVSGRGTEDELLQRKNALIEKLEDINASEKYEIILYTLAGRHGFMLHKLKPSAKEIQKSTDEENLATARAKLSEL